MPTVLGRPYEPDFTGLPVRMSGEDLGIWRRFQPLHQSKWLRLYFDVHLGHGRQNIGAVEPRMADFWQRETQKRADVLAELPNALWLIELRNAAQLNAIGRLLGYIDMWNEDPVINKPVVPMIVTNSPDPDVERVALKNGISYTVL